MLGCWEQGYYITLQRDTPGLPWVFYQEVSVGGFRSHEGQNGDEYSRYGSHDMNEGYIVILLSIDLSLMYMYLGSHNEPCEVLVLV